MAMRRAQPRQIPATHEPMPGLRLTGTEVLDPLRDCEQSHVGRTE